MSQEKELYTVERAGDASLSGVNKNEDKLHWNVLGKDEFRTRTLRVFDAVAKTLKNTLGPYGATTIIQKMSEPHFTKDGWQVLKNINFDNMIERDILQLLVNISSQVVIKVGDGSTSSIVAADSILKQMEKDSSIKEIRSKELMTLINNVVAEISDKILERSTKIDAEQDPELNDIYKLAMISTNGDEEISDIIRTIYKETLNPFIEYTKSKTNKTTYEIVEGYQGKVSYLDRIYVTNDEGTCEIKNPAIIMFDHKIEHEAHYKNFIQPALEKAYSNGQRLVVIAPYYDEMFKDMIQARTLQEFRQSSSSAIVYTRVMTTNTVMQEEFGDFAVMTGAQIVHESDVRSIVNQEEDFVFDIDNYIGYVNEISIGERFTNIRGFEHRDETMYQINLNDAKAKYAKLEADNKEFNVVDIKLYEMKKRVSKLTGRMGVINVGGASNLEKTSNYDLLEDAVKACESAFNYGYNIGGNLIIPSVVESIINELTANGEVTSSGKKRDKLVVLSLLHDAFINVFVEVLRNKYTDTPTEELVGKAKYGAEIGLCYDLIKEEYSREIVNPCYTDIEILKAATSIVSLILTSNQYISIECVNNL